MKAKEYLVLFALAALWGASFLFIRIAVAELSPVVLVGARFVVAALGLLGVAVVIGPTALTAGGSSRYLPGVAAILLGAVSYAFGGLFAHRMLAGLPSILPALGQTAMGACILGPIVGIALVASPPAHFPSTGVIVSVLALALGGTTLAYICFYWLIEHVGPTRTVIVTYLLPCMAVAYGTLLLHEAVNINALGGLLFVLLGIFLIGRRTRAHTCTRTHGASSDRAGYVIKERIIP